MIIIIFEDKTETCKHMFNGCLILFGIVLLVCFYCVFHQLLEIYLLDFCLEAFLILMLDDVQSLYAVFLYKNHYQTVQEFHCLPGTSILLVHLNIVESLYMWACVFLKKKNLKI